MKQKGVGLHSLWAPQHINWIIENNIYVLISVYNTINISRLKKERKKNIIKISVAGPKCSKLWIGATRQKGFRSVG